MENNDDLRVSTETKLNEMRLSLEQLEKLENEKNACLKELNISKLKKICLAQEKEIEKVLLMLKGNKLAKMDQRDIGDFVKKYHINKTILTNFKELAAIYFKPFKNENYNKDGKTKNLNLKSISIST